MAGDEDGCPGEEAGDGLARGVLKEGAVELHRAVLLLLRSIGSSVKLYSKSNEAKSVAGKICLLLHVYRAGSPVIC